MKRALVAVATVGVVALLFSMAPDIKRYLRIRSM